jgi:hypothetical protein
MKNSTDISVQYFIESLMLARSILLGALRWMNPKKTSASVLPSVVDALLILSDSAFGEATDSCRPKPAFGRGRRESGMWFSRSRPPSPVNVQSVAFDENRSRETRRLSVAEIKADSGGAIGEATPVAFPGVGDEIAVVPWLELLYKLPKQELPRLLSISAGRILLINGFIVGMQAHTIPRLTSTTLHMNDIEAW